MTAKRRYETNAGRAFFAWLAAAGVGGLLSAAVVGFVGSGGLPAGGEESTLVLVAFMVPIGIVTFAVAIVFPGAPVWWLFHALGLRSWPTALAIGSILTGCGGALMFSGMLHNAPMTFAAFAAVGAIAGVCLWRVAYRPVRAAPEAVF